MASNKIMRSGPTLLTTTTTTNLLNPGTTTGGTGIANLNTYVIISVVRLGCILTTGSAACAAWIGTTGVNTTATAWAGMPGQASAGALTAGSGLVLAAQQSIYIPCYLVLETADFFVGGAGTTTAITIDFEYEIGLR
jgi:hypothetical protein